MQIEGRNQRLPTKYKSTIPANVESSTLSVIGPL